MESHMQNILILNSKYYKNNILSETEYKNELSSLLQSLLLNFNTYLQLETHNIFNKYFSLSTLPNINSNNIKNISISNPNISSRYNIQSNINITSTLETSNISEENIKKHNNSLHLETISNQDLELEEQYNDFDLLETISNQDLELEEQYNDFDLLETISNKDLELEEQYNDFDLLEESNQCCARIGNRLFNLNILPSEFIDSYPADVFITDDGNVIGKSCLNLVNDYNEDTNYFCDEHKIGYEDIRHKPI